MNHCRWNILPPAPDEFLANTAGFSPLIAQLLYNRGLHDPSKIELFIAGDARLLTDPHLLPDMQTAAARIYRALLSCEKIAVYGDFDVDGITGTALLVQGLSFLGGNIVPYIPHRMTEGHGLRGMALEELKQQGVSLVVTVDCGVTDVAEVKHAIELGMDVIITDHHTPPAEIPRALAIVNPKLKNLNSELAGVGVAFKLVQALFHDLGKDAQLECLTDMVAAGTIADMVPLLGENRYLVKQGLKRINSFPRLWVKEISSQAGLSTGNLDAESISWCIAPWLNASGRLEHAMSSYKLLMTDSQPEAHDLAALLGQKNTERQRLTNMVLLDARNQILAQGVSPLLLVSSKEYPLGITGPVAGKLAEEFYRPVVVVQMDEVNSYGSCRSIPEFNIINALTRCGDMLHRFGGHAQAAGFTLPTRELPHLQQCLYEAAAAQLAGLDLRPHLDIDAAVTLPSLGGDTYQTIRKLAPFGKGNPPPIFISRGVQVVDCRTMGNGREHLRMKLKQGGTAWNAVAFRLGDSLGEVSSSMDIVYNLEIDRWGGVESLRLNILNFAPCQ